MNNLEEAAALIENGWCIGQLRNGDGKYCSVGAVLAVHGISEQELFHEVLDTEINGTQDPYKVANGLPEIRALADEIKSRGSYTQSDYADVDVVYFWNDQQDDENAVLEVFKHAAKRL